MYIYFSSTCSVSYIYMIDGLVNLLQYPKALKTLYDQMVIFWDFMANSQNSLRRKNKQPKNQMP